MGRTRTPAPAQAQDAALAPDAAPSADKTQPAHAFPAATCVDPLSGLYHRQHFQLSLAYELGRMNRTERPLGLVVVRPARSGARAVRAVANFLKTSLRPLDVAARLGEREIGVLLPEADRDRTARLLGALAARFGDGGPDGGGLAYGGTLARPWEDWTPERLLARARDGLDAASVVIARTLDAAGPWAEANTALAGPERGALFDGFSSLFGGPDGRPRTGR
jgi:GGDEF domain-containing protein